MTVLITGAAGFIGSHFTDRLLERGEEVVGLDLFDDFYDGAIKEANLARALDHNAFTLVRGDLRDGATLRALPDHLDTVVHLAARAGVRPSIERPLLYTDVNVRGTQEMLEFARERGIRPFVFASSSSVYGNNEKVPFAESDPVDHPISPYAATKKANELQCHAAAHLYGLSCICLRFFTVYGPRQRPDLAIRKFSRLLLSGQEIPRFGDGTTARDYTFIADILQGVEAALGWAREEVRPGEDRAGEGRFQVVNLGESRTITLDEMIRGVATAFGREPRVKELPMQPGDVLRTFADISKARELLGYNPTTDFEEGMARFAEWYLETGAREDGVAEA
jgi:UDP-glucuronate 4-epimerase